MLGSFLFTAMAATLPPPTLIVNRVASGYSLKLAEGAPFRTTSAQVTNRATFRLNDGSVIGFWKEDGVPRYLIAPDGRTVLREVEVDTKVSLKYATFDPLKSVPTIDETVATPNDNELCVVQFKTQPLSSYREAIEAAGGTWYDVVPTNSVICRIPASAREEVSKLNYVRWVGAYESAYKLAEIAMTPLRAGTLKTQEYDIWCNQRGIEMQQAVADRIESLGGRVIQLIPLGFRMTVELSPVQLKQVLGMNEIQFIDPHGPATQDMDIVRGYGGANFIETTLGFTGQGVRAEVMDGGLLQTHVAWGSAPLVHAPSLPVDSHGTATFGINFGNGTGNAAGRGMMPNAQGVMANYNAFNGGSRYTHTAQLLASPYFCVSQSNSWGNAQVTTYTAISAEMDDILYQNNIVILNSQSNTGNQTSRPQAWAKNIVSVGAFNHFNNTNDADDRWSGGASIGPAADGRVKPDIAYWYDNILCPTSSSTTAYTSGFGGTSAATPMTAGHFGLFFQMWHNGLFAVPVPAATVFDNRPKSTLAKAIMINTANQRTLPAPFDITRNVQGWGVVNLTSLYNARSKMLTVNETDVLTNLQTNSYKVQVAAGE
ncbi:MAG: S8 family serine peptidase, partial [Fimbriimonadaceae bacterium]